MQITRTNDRIEKTKNPDMVILPKLKPLGMKINRQNI
jgi:hypothetical protein